MRILREAEIYESKVYCKGVKGEESERKQVKGGRME